jgi:uncharacterized protein YjbI with pentapeptide repeats
MEVVKEKQGQQNRGQKEAHKEAPQPLVLREFEGKSIRSWLRLLIVPRSLSLITVGFAWQQGVHQERIESQRSKLELKVAKQRSQDEALQAYLDRMNTLIFEEDLLQSGEDSKVRMLARAYTLTILERIDPDRRSAVLQFLVESDLVNATQDAEPVISLADANLKGAKMFQPNLRAVDLRYADLENAKLEQANLKYANLAKATWFSNKEIDRQVYSLKGATMPNGQKYEDWRSAKEGHEEDK